MAVVPWGRVGGVGRVRSVLSPALLRQTIRFAVSTGISATITVGLPILLHEALHVPEERAVLYAFNTAIIVNFFVMRNFVFSGRGRPFQDALRYALANIGFRVAEYSAFLFILNVLYLQYVAAVLLVLSVSTALKFLAYRFVVFNGRTAAGTDAR